MIRRYLYRTDGGPWKVVADYNPPFAEIAFMQERGITYMSYDSPTGKVDWKMEEMKERNPL